ncbi:MAG: MBL fold metallo-hydrolase [Gemmatimonadota bacterium]|nr:MBL fold metallo-hydrolase [Gemmatimonadota bacterium]
MSASLELGRGVEWIHECYSEPTGHLHVSVYLVRAPGGDILVDSGSFYHRDSLHSRIESATDGRGPRALILSHSDYPHSGNIPTFREEWGDFEIVASVASPEIQGLPYARRARIGESLDVLGRRFTFLDPPLADRSHTTWIYDEEGKTLFVADGFGTIHPPGHCDSWWGDLPLEGRTEGVLEFHDQTLRWLIYVDPDRLMTALRDIFARHPAEVVAPIHGPPIARADLEAYLDDLESGVRTIVSTHAAMTTEEE